MMVMEYGRIAEACGVERGQRNCALPRKHKNRLRRGYRNTLRTPFYTSYWIVREEKKEGGR